MGTENNNNNNKSYTARVRVENMFVKKERKFFHHSKKGKTKIHKEGNLEMKLLF